MLTDLKQFLRTHFQRTNNGLMQLVLVNGLVFIGLLLMKMGLVLAGFERWYQVIIHYLTLSAAFDTLLQQPWRLFTYFWIHEGFFDLLWQLLFLYTFGQIFLYQSNSRRLIALYMLGGIGGGLAFLLIHYWAPGFHHNHASLMGALPSLYAVMAGVATLLPNFYLQLLLIGKIRIKYIAVALILLACFELSQHQSAGIANLGGALIGYLYVGFGAIQSDRLKKWWKNSKQKSPQNSHLKITYQQTQTTPHKTNNQGHNQAIMDKILDKVASSGYESLTNAEKKQLFEAGQ